MPRPRSDGMQPSTSKDVAKTEPHSPVERLAKRNALLMNELDSKGKRSYFSNVMGTVPEFPITDIGATCNAIGHILEYDSSAITSEILVPLQKQLEDLIADNADHQKRLNGEITFLSTGDYPTSDLRDRLLPVYKLREKNFDEPDSVSHEKFVDRLVDMGLNSSPEEDIKNPTVTDVPRRFWNWTREYLGHITAEDIVKFKAKIVDGFRGEQLQHYLQNASPQKCKGAAKKPTKRRASQDLPIPAKIRPSDLNSSKYESMLTQAFAFVIETAEPEYKKQKENGIHNDESREEVVSKSHESNGFTSPSRRSSLRQEIAHEQNGQNGHRNDSLPSTPLNGFKKLPDPVTPFSNGSSPISFTLKNGFMVESNGFEMEDYLNGEDADENLDEVSREIKKKQRELMGLSQTTRPLIDAIYERMEGEYALYEVSRRLDLAEDKLFELGKKYDGIQAFSKEQRKECTNALAERHAILQQMYRYRFQQKMAGGSDPKTSPVSRKVSFSMKHSIIKENVALSNTASSETSTSSS